ncbi:MAG: transcription antitermination protein NusB [Bacteroidales bacterium]
MLNRHLLRIKVFQTIYSFRKSADNNFVAAYSELTKSINESYLLYIHILLFLIELKQHSETRIEQIQARVVQNETEWKKLVPLSQNSVLTELEQNKELQQIIQKEKISWHSHKEIIKELFTYIIESEKYQQYSESEQTEQQDKKILKFILESVIGKSESFFSFIEEKSIFWNDEIDQIISMVYKTINKLKTEKIILPVFKDAEAKHFVEKLLTTTIKNWDEYNNYIVERLKNWELERVAETDLIIMHVAITEAINFTEIPIRVTLNEYIEISKKYSTEKSNVFINGLLHKLCKDLEHEKIIVKTGRGLMS